MSTILLDYFIVIVLGLIIGSFLNVVILRFDNLKSVINSRSHCPKCRKNLSWLDLIPVLSYVFLGGKCRYCDKRISLQYPLVELATAAVFALIFWKFGLSLQGYFLFAITAVLIVIFVYDMLKTEISDWLVIAIACFWLAYLGIDYFFINHSALIILNSLYGALFLGGFLGLLVLVSNEKWMGKGDIGLGAVIGLICGWPLVTVATISSFMIGSVVGIALIALGKKQLQSQVPFAPFLILGLLVTIVWGKCILDWYLGGLI